MRLTSKALLCLTLLCSVHAFAITTPPPKKAPAKETVAKAEPEKKASKPKTIVKVNLHVEIIDPFADLHTGPGRGYPIFFTAEQGEYITLVKRRTNWYLVETDNGTQGWVASRQLARTLKPSGQPLDLPTTGHGEFLASAWRVGFSANQFEGANGFSMFGGYRALTWLGAELEYGEIFGQSANLNYYGANVIIEPLAFFEDLDTYNITPFIALGTGQMTLDSPIKRVKHDVKDANYQQYGLGLNYYIGFNFVIRSEYRWYATKTNQNDNIDFNEWKLGFSTFF